VEGSTLRTLLFVVAFFPLLLVGFMTMLGEKLVEEFVVGWCRHHTWYALAHHHIVLLVVLFVAE
jgi:hypothetical protein